MILQVRQIMILWLRQIIMVLWLRQIIMVLWLRQIIMVLWLRHLVSGILGAGFLRCEGVRFGVHEQNKNIL